jgi:hypothetical protein
MLKKRKIIIFAIMVISIFNSCKSQEKTPQERNSNESQHELQPLIFGDFQETNKYLNDTILEYMYKQCRNTEADFFGLVGSDNSFVLADLDKDGTYELYINSNAGSGYIHFYIHGYNPINNKCYIMSERFKTDYRLFIYKFNIYVFAEGAFPNPPTVKIYRPSLKNDELIFEEIDENLYLDILGAVKSTVKSSDFWHSINF